MAIKLSEYKAYFRTLSQYHKEIGHSETEQHFYCMELEEVLMAARGGINPISCILESYDASFEDSNSDNVMKKRNGAFIIMGKVSDISNFEEITEVREKCEAIGDDFIKMMYRHKVSKQVALLRYFDFPNVESQFVDVKPMNETGMRFSFSILSQEGNEIDTTKWNSLDSVIVVNADNLVHLNGQVLPRTVRKNVLLTLPGGEDPFIYETLSREEPYDIEITDENGYILGIPGQVDARIVLSDTGFYEIHLVTGIPLIVKLSYK
jgi:hypothetical protein